MTLHILVMYCVLSDHKDRQTQICSYVAVCIDWQQCELMVKWSTVNHLYMYRATIYKRRMEQSLSYTIVHTYE